jgi:transcriptional regulator with XRE-family HTH domain
MTRGDVTPCVLDCPVAGDGSERMGVDRAYVIGLEKGKRNPTIIALWHTAKALGVKLQELVSEPKRRSGR